jgi:hypothetical protein
VTVTTSYDWDDLCAVIALTGDANHIHIPGSPMEWRHDYVPIAESAARSHGHGKVPKGWKAPSGGARAGKAVTAETGSSAKAPSGGLRGLAAKHGMRTMTGNGETLILPKGGGIVSPVLRVRDGHYRTVNGEDVDPGEVEAYLSAYSQHPKALSGGLLDHIRGGPASPPDADAEWKRTMDAMAAREKAAGIANARGMDRMQAHHDAARQHLRESAGITIPFAQEFSLGLGHSDYSQAENHLLNGRYGEAAAALDRALAAERSRPGLMSKAQTARLAKLEKFRDQVTQAAAHPKATLPALAKLNGTRQPDGSFTALDQNGAEHTVKLEGTPKSGTVTVSTAKGTRSMPALGDPTYAARILAGNLAGTNPVYGASKRGKPVMQGDTVVVPYKSAGKWSETDVKGGKGVVYGATGGDRVLVATGDSRGYISASPAEVTHAHAAGTVQAANPALAAVELSSRTRKDGPVSVTAVKPKTGQGMARSGLAPGFSPVARGAAPAGQRQAPASLAKAPPSRRPKVTPLSPMRRDTAKSMRKLAAHVQGTHPDMTVHEHLRDAARTLEKGNEEGAQRHLRAAMFALTPQSLMRNGLHTDEHHQAAREAMHGVHRHMLLTKDIADVAARNQQALARTGTGDDTAAPPRADPNAGYGPGALAQKPAARQPPGDQALNAPAKADGGGSDPAVADPNGPQRPGSKQFSTWDEVSAGVLDMAGPGGFLHGWKPSGPTAALHDKAARLHTQAAEKAKDPAVKARHLRRARVHAQVARKLRSLTPPSPAAPAGGALLAYDWDDVLNVAEFSARTAMLEATPAPIGKPGGPGLYGIAGLGHSSYFEQVRNGLMKRGVPEGRAHAMTWGILRRWAAGGGKVHPEVRAAAAKALAEEAAKRAQAKAQGHAVTGDDISAVITLTGDARHHHIPGSPMEYEHGYNPLTPAAAKSHFGKVPKGWSPSSGGGGKASGPAHLKFTDASGRVSYHTIHDPETAGKIRDQAKQRGMTAEEGGAARDPGIEKMPKNARALHEAARQAGWNVSHYPGEATDVKFDAAGHPIPGTATPLHAVSAHNPVTGQTVRQSWNGNKVSAHPQGESLSASIAAVKAHPVTPEQLKALTTPAGKQARIASRIGGDATEFSARGLGTNAQKVGYLMGQAADALSAGDKKTAISHLLAAQSASVTGHEVFAKGTGYAQAVIAKHLKSLGADGNPQFAYSWRDLDTVIEMAAAQPAAGGGPPPAPPAASQSGGSGSPQARVPSGQAGGGQFGSGGGQAAAPKPDAHQQHVAHLAHLAQVATQKAALLATAADDRNKAAALVQQRAVLVKALASAGGKVSAGQAGAKTATTAKTKTTAPATTGTAAPAAASTATAAAKAPAKAASTTAKAATAAPGTAAAKATAAQLTTQIGALSTQISQLLAAANQATAQATALK